MREHELRASLQAVGALLPALVFRDQLIDGSRRVAICDELQIHLPQRRLRSLHEACSALWVLHPKRALALAPADLSLLELAKLCGTEPASIAALRAKQRPPREDGRRIPNRTALASVKLQVWIEPQLRDYADRAGEVLNLNRAAVVRRAIWNLCAVTVPRAPLHPPRHLKEQRRRAPYLHRRRSGDPVSE